MNPWSVSFTSRKTHYKFIDFIETRNQRDFELLKKSAIWECFVFSFWPDAGHADAIRTYLQLGPENITVSSTLTTDAMSYFYCIFIMFRFRKVQYERQTITDLCTNSPISSKIYFEYLVLTDFGYVNIFTG